MVYVSSVLIINMKNIKDYRTIEKSWSIVFQLNDVELGGATAFPHVGVAVKPVKGSAIYWNNVLSSGRMDDSTWHGACPVIMGEKWGYYNFKFNDYSD